MGRVKATVSVDRGAHAQEDDVRVRRGLRGVGSRVQTPPLHEDAKPGGQFRIIEGNGPSRDPLDPGDVVVHASYGVSCGAKRDTGRNADISRANNRDSDQATVRTVTRGNNVVQSVIKSDNGRQPTHEGRNSCGRTRDTIS